MIVINYRLMSSAFTPKLPNYYTYFLLEASALQEGTPDFQNAFLLAVILAFLKSYQTKKKKISLTTKLANSYNYGVSISNGQVSKDCLHFL